jgi:hypothetical protein
MPQVGFEAMMPAFEQEKIFHSLDGAATVIGRKVYGAKREWIKLHSEEIHYFISSPN